MEFGSLVCHTVSPFRTSKAKMSLSQPPATARPPAVVSAALVNRCPEPTSPQDLAGPHAHRQELAELVPAVGIEVVRATNRSRTAATGDAFDRAEHRGLAVEVDGNVEGLGAGVIRHGAPALEPGGARAPVHLFTKHRDGAIAVGHRAGGRVDVGDRLVPEIVRVAEPSGLERELPQDTEFPHCENRPPVVVVDQDALEHLVMSSVSPGRCW